MTGFTLTPAQESKLEKIKKTVKIIGIDDQSLLIEGQGHNSEHIVKMIAPDGRIRKASDHAKFAIWKRRKELRERSIRQKSSYYTY